MFILRPILRNEVVEDCFHVHTHIRVSILIDAQSATGVLREDVHNTSLWQLRQLTHDFACNQVEPASLWIQCYFYLLYHIIDS